MIKKIQVLDSNYGQQLFMLQKKAYQIEADIIEFTDIPPLLETYDQFINCNETFIGFFKADTLAGAISYTKEIMHIEICRIVVHPDYFRQGIAETLLNHLQFTCKWEKLSVSTGKMNLPARKLYEKNGFTHTKDVEAAPHFYISLYEKNHSFNVRHDKEHDE
ncbi:GNAT family N-acetyltransferase [Peribacillus butanolivorans]|uniref:GNAT family N-acetyltransferase n=1 Tax=Peribacillus butanolivorans TaxID=421767 RepID=UPI0036C6CB36